MRLIELAEYYEDNTVISEINKGDRNMIDCVCSSFWFPWKWLDCCRYQASNNKLPGDHKLRFYLFLILVRYCQLQDQILLQLQSVKLQYKPGVQPLLTCGSLADVCWYFLYLRVSQSHCLVQVVRAGEASQVWGVTLPGTSGQGGGEEERRGEERRGEERRDQLW